jgi:hypothetical protein
MMKHRIEELLAASTIHGVPQLDIADSIDYEKFAELIIRQCAQFVEDKFDLVGEEIVIKEKMLEHFGVE